MRIVYACLCGSVHVCGHTLLRSASFARMAFVATQRSTLRVCMCLCANMCRLCILMSGNSVFMFMRPSACMCMCIHCRARLLLHEWLLWRPSRPSPACDSLRQREKQFRQCAKRAEALNACARLTRIRTSTAHASTHTHTHKHTHTHTHTHTHDHSR